MANAVPALMSALHDCRAHVGVIGMGYVGLTAALSAVRAGFTATGFDVDEPKIDALRRGVSFLSQILSCAVTNAPYEGHFVVATNFERLLACDAILICVPTPLTKHCEPDLSFVVGPRGPSRPVSAQDNSLCSSPRPIRESPRRWSSPSWSGPG
jgi:UDP-N-acetyl-D-mannosaminuronate dehydrogenase